jgi:hypothetical protein
MEGPLDEKTLGQVVLWDVGGAVASKAKPEIWKKHTHCISSTINCIASRKISLAR